MFARVNSVPGRACYDVYRFRVSNDVLKEVWLRQRWLQHAHNGLCDRMGNTDCWLAGKPWQAWNVSDKPDKVGTGK
jgi:hypothetical protein